MNEFKASSLQSLIESEKGSVDSLLAGSLQLDIEDLDDTEYSIPALDSIPTLESVLNDLEADSDNTSEVPGSSATPTPSYDDPNKTSSILRHIVLQGISSQISSAADRINAGFSTAIAISSMIAIGTSHGHILNFDNSQTLRWAYQDDTSQGAVSSLAFNDDSTRLLAGFARGLLIMFDTKTGTVLRKSVNIITANAGILILKWTGKPGLAICLDSGGSVWSLTFTRTLGIRGCVSRCLFSGARGEVCVIEPLKLDNDNNELESYCIIALATLSKFFVVTIRPRLKVIKFNILNGPPECLPLLAWQMVLIQAADTSRSINPVLAVARGNQLYFHQVSINNSRLQLSYLRHVQLSCNLLAIHWLGPKSLACLNITEVLHLIDVRTSKELENIDLGGVGLVYGSAQYKGLATGGNVSPALALAGTHACYNSVVSKGIQLYILGARNVDVISKRSLSEKIAYLIQNQRWIEACEVAINVYHNAENGIKRKQQAKEKIIQLFEEYLSYTYKAPEYCLGPIIKCMIEINEIDLLWQKLWDRLNSPTLFLTLITEHIENEEIKNVSPQVAQALVEYWTNFSMPKLENIILKLNWECLDLHQVLTIARNNKLYKAQMYLNSKALKDYTISLIELIPQIHKEDVSLGNSILVYISSCLAGRGYPTGDIPTDEVLNVKHDIMRCLTAINYFNDINEDDFQYPYLRHLLKFDARETLNVLSLAFEEKEFNGELGLSQRQRIINILMEIITPQNDMSAQIGCLLNFLSQQFSQKGLPRDQLLADKILEYLRKEDIFDETFRLHTEREQAWLELLEANFFFDIKMSCMLAIAKKAKCYSVIEYLLEKLGMYDDIPECYLKNQLRNNEIFDYIDRHANSPKRKIYQFICKNLEILLNLDSYRITKIIIDKFSDSIEDLISLLINNDKSLYLFLKNLIKYNVTLDSKNTEIYLELLCIENPEDVKEFLISNDNYKIVNALEIVSKYQLFPSTALLYEKLGDYDNAFKILLNLLKESSENTAEISAIQVSSLCTRASQILSEEQCKDFWFPLLKIVLERTDLVGITRNMLHCASQYVNLSDLVELVVTSGTQSGSFGDIKDLLISMLSNSRYESLLLQTTARIFGHDLHNQFNDKKNLTNRGLWITFVKCIICRQRLYNQTDILIYGSCGHPMHELCKRNYIENNPNSCPRCGLIVNNLTPIKVSKPSLNIVNNFDDSTKSENLQLKAPCLKFKKKN